jgi:hypothetical protein
VSILLYLSVAFKAFATSFEEALAKKTQKNNFQGYIADL